MTNHTKEQVNEIIKKELKDLSHISDILSKNINRSLRLLHQSIKLKEHSDNIIEFLGYISDVVRATIVFLHSSLETTLREILRLSLKDGADISYVPLAGQSDFRNRKEKFSLADLAKYRNKSVSEVIDASIDEYLSGVSFNNSKDITDTFTKLGFPQSTLQKYYPILDEMIERRHQIVHEGDLKRDPKSSELEPIPTDKLKVWIEATSGFCVEVIRLTVKRLYLEKIKVRLKEIGVDMSNEQIYQSIKIESKDTYG